MTVALIHRNDYGKPIEKAIQMCDGFEVEKIKHQRQF